MESITVESANEFMINLANRLKICVRADHMYYASGDEAALRRGQCTEVMVQLTWPSRKLIPSAKCRPVVRGDHDGCIGRSRVSSLAMAGGLRQAAGAIDFMPTNTHSKSAKNGLDFLEETSEFVSQLASSRLEPGLHVRAPDQFSVDHILSCYRVSDVVMEAMTNQFVVPWSADDVMEQVRSRKRGFTRTLPEALGNTLRGGKDWPRYLTIVDHPCHVVDKDGKVLLVYLPGVLRADQQVTVDAAVEGLGKAAEGQLVTKKEGNWRALEKYFKQPQEGTPVGVASYSPCWFTMGHPAPAFKPKLSATIRQSDGSDGGIPFVTAMQEEFALIGSALRILHPEQYAIGLQAWKELRRQVDTKAAQGFGGLMGLLLDTWASPFTVAQVISNRRSPLHCDTKGFPHWYDGLVTYGHYQGGFFETPGLGRKLHMIQHEVPDVEGERGCIASFMRPEVVRYALDNDACRMGGVPIAEEIRAAILQASSLSKAVNSGGAGAEAEADR
ncbi:hypothetical protein BKA70DRAFT_1401130 [Coprinopsis sp. MPI-PUGE-AT-0042]|nr:hypothetical protein BKA70DRAFT_1401130 [Coprinopsis sp. MPI-PUGE-AT-0042]